MASGTRKRPGVSASETPERPDVFHYSPGRLRLPLAHIAILLPLCWILFFHHVAVRDLWSSHEARAGMDAQTMLDDGQWLLPHLYDGRPEVQKPPLYYWFVALIARAGGGQVDAWSVRLPATASALLCVLAVYGIGWLRGRTIAGLVAACILATAVQFTWLSRIGRIDMPLTLTTTLAIGGFYLGMEEGRQRGAWLLLAYLALAMGVLLKGPLGLVLPFGVLGVFLLTEGRRECIWKPSNWPNMVHRLGLWWGLPLAAILTVPWFFLANQATQGKFFQEFFWHHNFERALGNSPLFEHHGTHLWWFYGSQFLAEFLPWTPVFVVAVWSWVRGNLWDHDRDARLGLVWLITIMGFLSFSSFKRADYLLPALPGAALFVGCIAERWCGGAKRASLIGLFGVVVFLCGIGWIIKVDWSMPREESQFADRPFAEAIRREAPLPQPVLFFRTEAHGLAFHVGRPLDVFVEWERLEALSAKADVSWIVMPVKWFEEVPADFPKDRLEVVLYQEDLTGARRHEPLVLLKTHPPHEPIHARNAAVAADRVAAH
jgi:4-amino-4-deoxy-L-arabinose transferase-like glycosyltransferase